MKAVFLFSLVLIAVTSLNYASAAYSHLKNPTTEENNNHGNNYTVTLNATFCTFKLGMPTFDAHFYNYTNFYKMFMLL